MISPPMNHSSCDWLKDTWSQAHLDSSRSQIRRPKKQLQNKTKANMYSSCTRTTERKVIGENQTAGKFAGNTVLSRASYWAEVLSSPRPHAATKLLKPGGCNRGAHCEKTNRCFFFFVDACGIFPLCIKVFKIMCFCEGLFPSVASDTRWAFSI